MKKQLILLTISLISTGIFAQHNTQSRDYKSLIKNDLEELERIYINKLSYPEGKRSEEIMRDILIRLERMEQSPIETKRANPYGHAQRNNYTRTMSQTKFDSIIWVMKREIEKDPLNPYFIMDQEVYSFSAEQMAIFMSVIYSNNIMVMSPEELNEFAGQVGNAFPDREKYNLIEQRAVCNYFTAEQVVRLMKSFSFDDDRLKLVDMVFPKIVDKEMAYQLFGALTHGSSKDKLQRILDKYMRVQ